MILAQEKFIKIYITRKNSVKFFLSRKKQEILQKKITLKKFFYNKSLKNYLFKNFEKFLENF